VSPDRKQSRGGTPARFPTDFTVAAASDFINDSPRPVPVRALFSYGFAFFSFFFLRGRRFP
jgi:hypothetical protein